MAPRQRTRRGRLRRSSGPAAAWSGEVAPGFEALAALFAQRVRSGRRGGALTVLRDEEVLADVWTGWADRARTRPWTADTLSLSFSTTKGLAATVIHRLADRGLLGYDDPVADHWSQFAAAGKESITVGQLLSHRAGLHDVRGLLRRPGDVLDHLAMEERLAAARPAWPPGPPAYHAFTFGWLTAGLARAITGKGMAALVREELAEPLGTPGLHVGRPPEGSPLADVLGGSLRLLEGSARAGGPLWGRVPVTRAGANALLVPGFARLVRGPRIWDTEMPAVNGALSARGLARLYSALANGGETGGRRLLSPETVSALGRVQTRAADRVLGMRMRWRLGYHQALSFGAPMPLAFGHYGFGGSGGWADPATGLSLGFVTNDTGTLTTPIGDFTLFRLSALARACLERREPLRYSAA